MPEVVNNECLVKCKDCGAVVTAKWVKGILKKGWRLQDGGVFSDGTCPQCHKKMTLKGMETILCSRCGKLVEKTEDGMCLACHKKLDEIASRGQIECPECGMKMAIPKEHVGAFTCVICGHVIDEKTVDQLIAKKNVYTEQYIKLPDVETMLKNDWAVWKHPQSEFPFKSRMQVNEGTTALFLQNGACNTSCDPGHYLLQDSDLQVTEKLTAAFEGDDKVFNTDIFCVLKDLPEMGWGVGTSEFWDMERSARYTAACNGKAALQVSDGKAYARYIGFKPFTVSELTMVNPVPGSPDGVLVQLLRDVIKDAVYACLNGRPGDMLDTIVSDEIKDAVIIEANRRMASFGVQLKSLWINGLELNRSGATTAADQIRDYVQSEIAWSVKKVRLHIYQHTDMYADVDFDGRCRLKILDDKAFLNTSEMKKLIENQQNSEIVIKDVYSHKVEAYLRNILTLTGQERIDHGDIADILDPNQYVYALRDRVQERLNYELSLDGLTLAGFSLSLPENIQKSDTLANRLDMPKRKSTIKYAVESMLPLKTIKPVSVHVKDNKSISAEMTFGGRCHLRVRDEEGFFKMTEIQHMLNDNQPISETSVRDYYVSRLNPKFEEILGIVIQSIVDQTNADLREMNRLLMLIKNSVQDSLAQLVEQWGLRMETLDLEIPVMVGKSANFDKMIAVEQTSSGIKLDEELQKMQNDHVIFTVDEKGRVEMRGMDAASKVHQHEVDVNKADQIHDMDANSDIRVHDKDIYGRERMHDDDVDTKIEINTIDNREQVDARKDQIRLDKLERDSAYEMVRLQRAGDLDKLADEIQYAKNERSDEAVLDEYKRRFRIREEEINEKIITDRKLQEAKIDLDMAAQKAEFEKKLADKENELALNEIIRKINESNLTWRQKLDEYDRLRKLTDSQNDAEIRELLAKADSEVKLTGAKTDADIDEIKAGAKIRISRDQEDAYYHAGDLKLKLREQEAKLIETINLYEEQRNERILAAKDAREERRAILDFEQRMQDRREQVAQKIEEIGQRYEHELAMRDREVDLEKFKEQLKYATHETTTKAEVDINRDKTGADVSIAQAQADSAARIAEAEAAVRRAEEQLKREEAIAKEAEEFRKQLLEIQKALEMTRLDNDRNRDDKMAEVAVETAKAITETWPKPPVHQPYPYPYPQPQTGGGASGSKDFDKLNNKMQRVVDSVRDLKNSINELTRLIIVATANGAGRGASARGGDPERTHRETDSDKIRCTLCSRMIPKDSNSCPYCGTPVIRQ